MKYFFICVAMQFASLVAQQSFEVELRNDSNRTIHYDLSKFAKVPIYGTADALILGKLQPKKSMVIQTNSSRKKIFLHDVGWIYAKCYKVKPGTVQLSWTDQGVSVVQKDEIQSKL